MGKVLSTTAAVIDAFGGNRPFGTLANDSKPTAVSNWRNDGHFPGWTYPIITRAAQKEGLVVPDHLFVLTRKRRRRKKKAKASDGSKKPQGNGGGHGRTRKRAKQSQKLAERTDRVAAQPVEPELLGVTDR